MLRPTRVTPLAIPSHAYGQISTTQRSTKVNKKTCIFLLESCKSFRNLQQIHGQIFRIGLDQSKDIVNRLITFCALSHPRHIRYADVLFSTIRSRWLFIFNVMIKAFCNAGSLHRALILYGELCGEGLMPDNFTYPLVLKAIGGLRAVDYGTMVHTPIVKSGLLLDTFVKNSLICMYFEIGRIDCGEQVFDEMTDRDVVSWNVLISCYVKSGKPTDALNTFKRMEVEEVRPDEATFVSTISACINLGNLDFGKRIHSLVEEELESSIALGNALMDMYCKCGSIFSARHIFNKMKGKNVISWTTMISGCVEGGSLDDAKELFDLCPERDAILWTAIINGYMQFNRFSEALDLFQQMQVLKVKPDKFTAATVLTVCAHIGALKQGEWLHKYIEQSGISIDAFVGTALLDMYAKCGCIDKSLEIFQQIKQKDTTSWTAVICGLAMNGQTTKALQLFEEMRGINTKPDAVTFIGILTACSHGGLVDEGYRYFDLMKNVYKLEPQIEHYGCLVDLLGRSGLLEEAEQLMETIPNSTECFPLWGSLLSACRIHGRVKMGERIMRHLSATNDAGIQTLLSNMYASANRWEDMSKLRRMMKRSTVEKIPGCSSIEVNGMVHEFIVRDTSHPLIDEVYSVVDGIGKLLQIENV